MRKTQNHQWKPSALTIGANRDTDPSLSQNDKGHYFDSTNSRATGEGEEAARVKIKGEEVFYENLNNTCIDGGGTISDNYKSIGGETINGHKVEVWADAGMSQPTLIRIDGKIVCRSEKLPWTVNNPLQIEKNEDCTGGEFYATDYQNTPLIFSVEDLMKNSGMTGETCTQKYFDEFVLDAYSLFIGGSYESMVFEELTTGSNADHVFTATGSTGLPVGLYSYSYRFADGEGNRTEFSPPTPMIPVIRKLTSEAPAYHGQMSRGDVGNSDVSGNTQFGIKLAMRVNNTQGYTQIEIRRTQWNNEDGVYSPPSSVICGLFEVQPGEFNVIRIIDRNGYEEDLGATEEYDSMSTIDTCKTIRYENRRLWIGNIKYASRVVKAADVEFVNPNTKYISCLKKLGKIGHIDPKNFTYYRSNVSGEKTGYAVMFWDTNGRYSFPLPIENMDNVLTPSRRQAMTTSEKDVSYEGSPVASTNTGSISEVHEVVDMSNAVAKSDLGAYHNILKKGKRKESHIEDDFFGVSVDPTPSEYTEYDTLPIPGQYVHAQNIGYKPFTPVNQGDTNYNSLNWRVNPNVRINGNYHEYNPKGFSPEYYSKGIAFTGLKKWPSWAKGMSIVSTESAKRVVSQGLAFYSMNSSGGLFGVGTTKNTNKAWCFFPDLDPNIGIYPEWYEDFLSNPSNYQVEVQAPLGLFSEIYSFKSGTTFQPDSHVDMMVYARVMKEIYDSSIGTYGINPNEYPDMGIGLSSQERHVAFGKWRSENGHGGIFSGNQNTTISEPINITAINQDPQYKGRGEYVELTMDKDLFWYAAPGGTEFIEDSVKDWHEPVYVINIIRKNAVIGNANTTDYYFRGNYQKFSSTIGYSNGTPNQSFEIIGERWEDCVNYINDTNASSPYLQLHRFVYVKGADNIEKRWVCVSYMDETELNAILLSIQSTGSAEVSDDSGTYTVHGVYTHTENSNGTILINFQWSNTLYNQSAFVPENESQVIVNYDNRIPIRVFGGESQVAESVFSPIDLQTNSDGNHTGVEFRSNLGFPFKTHVLNPRQFIANDANDGALEINKVQDRMVLSWSNSGGGISADHAKIRQMCVMFTCECRTSMAFRYNDETTINSNLQTFPLKNYVMRPHQWSEATDGIQDGYWDSYGSSEVDNWIYGGIRYIGQTNIDLSKSIHNGAVYRSVPKVGFVEQAYFKTRVCWSLERPTNVQNAPGLRTFPELNFYDIDDNQGEIKFIWSGLSDKGVNLIVLTETGVSLCMINKRALTTASSGSQDILAFDNKEGILIDEWISKSNGSPKEFWRTIQEDGDTLYFLSQRGAFMIRNNDAVDISEGYGTILNKFIDAIGEGYDNDVASYVDKFFEDYAITVTKKEQGVKKKYYHLSISDSLYVVQSNQDTPMPVPESVYQTGNYIDVEGPSVLIVNALEPTETQYGIDLGKTNWNLLGSSVTIKVPSWSPFAVKVRYKKQTGPASWIQDIVNVQPGESIDFTATINNLLINYAADTYWVSFVATGSIYTAPVEELMKDRCDTLVYGIRNKAFQGRNAYRFDSYYSDFDNVYGMRNGRTFKLNQGDLINGEPILFSVTAIHNENQSWGNEQIAIKINGDRPSEVQFYRDGESLDNEDFIARIDGNSMRAQQGYISYIPRDRNSRKRIQGRHLLMRIMHNLAGPFKIETINVQHKQID